MDVDVEPEAAPDERRAIVAAVGGAGAVSEPDAYASPWWRAGLCLDGAEAYEAAPLDTTARRRNSAGALRA